MTSSAATNALGNRFDYNVVMRFSYAFLIFVESRKIASFLFEVWWGRYRIVNTLFYW